MLFLYFSFSFSNPGFFFEPGAPGEKNRGSPKQLIIPNLGSFQHYPSLLSVPVWNPPVPSAYMPLRDGQRPPPSPPEGGATMHLPLTDFLPPLKAKGAVRGL